MRWPKRRLLKTPRGVFACKHCALLLHHRSHLHVLHHKRL
jgi:hypothetical protein